MPFVFKKQGKYLRYSENTTHTGTHRQVDWVDRLQDATVGAYLPLSLRKELQGAEQLEVLVTRTVVLKSEAEADEAAWLEAFIRRAGFTYGWENLESWARRMAEQAYEERSGATNTELLNALKYIVGCSSPMTPQQTECWPVMCAAIAKAEAKNLQRPLTTGRSPSSSQHLPAPWDFPKGEDL